MFVARAKVWTKSPTHKEHGLGNLTRSAPDVQTRQLSVVGHGLCGVWMPDVRVLVLVLVLEQGVTFSIGHSTLSLLLCISEIGTF